MSSPKSPNCQAELNEYSEASPSIGNMIQCSATALENECANIEARIKEKRIMLKELKENCARQNQNNSKQQLELEHLKVLTHCEHLKNESCLEKNRKLKEKNQILHKYIIDFFDDINPIMESRQELEDIPKQLKIKQDSEQESFNILDKANEEMLRECNKSLLKLKSLREMVVNEFYEMKNHLQTELEHLEEQEKINEKTNLKLECDCREMTIMINMINSQDTKLKETLNNLEMKLATEIEEGNNNASQLQSRLQEQLKRKDNLLSSLETVEYDICVTNSSMREKEGEINKHISEQKQLIVEGEELSKISKSQAAELNDLHTQFEAKKALFSINEGINKENASLKLHSFKLKEDLGQLEDKMNDFHKIESSFTEQLETLKENIKQLQSDIDINLNERSHIETEIEGLLRQLSDSINEHEHISAEIDEYFANLKKESDLLSTSLKLTTTKLSEATNNKENCKNTNCDLEMKLENVKAVSEDNDYQLSNYDEWAKMTMEDMKKEKINLDKMIKQAKEDVKRARSEVKMNEEVKEQLKQLEENKKNQYEKLASTIKQMQESQSKQIEEKTKMMADIRIEYELQFRNKEHSKTDAVIELKENKARNSDLQEDEKSIKEEVEKTQKYLEKCDNLIRKLENKLSVVANVAITSSQSVGDSVSQSKNINNFQPFGTNKENVKSSPCSESSGQTFNPDDLDSLRKKLGQSKRFNFPVASFPEQPKKLFTKKQTTTKKNSSVSKKSFQEEKDDWGFEY